MYCQSLKSEPLCVLSVCEKPMCKFCGIVIEKRTQLTIYVVSYDRSSSKVMMPYIRSAPVAAPTF